MNQVGWMHRDVSAGNCLLTCDPADGPSFVSDIELAKKMGSKTSPCSSAIPVGAPVLQAFTVLMKAL
jgi:hypothetical protein